MIYAYMQCIYQAVSPLAPCLGADCWSYLGAIIITIIIITIIIMIVIIILFIIINSSSSSGSSSSSSSSRCWRRGGPRVRGRLHAGGRGQDAPHGRGGERHGGLIHIVIMIIMIIIIRSLSLVIHILLSPS